jgi:putative mRNA 3-end processing factor
VPLLELRPAGLYCPLGDFYIDPWKGVDRAIITHGHADHARGGSQSYLCCTDSVAILQTRLGPHASIQGVAYGETVHFSGVNVTLYPAGHILGAAQVKVESGGYSWVVSGDYKVEPDATCAAFQPVRCHSFVTEATFALPIYRWRPSSEVFSQVNDWWQANAAEKRASVLYAYSLGKAQRLLSGVNPDIGPLYTHGAVERMNEVYRQAGVMLPRTTQALDSDAASYAGSLIVAPPGVEGSTWLRRFGDCSTAIASGWMQVRGQRRRRAVDRGFTLSDHADWPGLLGAIRETGAETIWVTHGSIEPLVRWLNENGWDAKGLATQFTSDEAEAAE